MVQFMTRRTEGQGRLDRFETLIYLAKKLGCELAMIYGGTTSYCPDDEAVDPAGAIVVESTDPRVLQIRQLAHEITHHILTWGLASIPSPIEEELQKYGPSEMVEEQVCRAVEDLVLALPSGLQWDGKIGVPRGDGRIRVFRRFRIPQSMNIPADEIDRLVAEMDE